MEGDDSDSRSVQGLVGLGLQKESQYLLKPRANKMEGEEKKSGSKRRSKPVEVRFDSDDDEPIGALFKVKRPRNPKMNNSGEDGSGDKGKKFEDRAEKAVVEDNEDLGGMDDTLASFRKKLKGPKKDIGSVASVGRSTSLGVAEQSDRLLNGPVKEGGLASRSISKVVEKGQVIVDKGLEIKPKGKSRRSKRASMLKDSGGHSEFDDDSDYQKLVTSSFQNQEEGGLCHGESSGRSSVENLEDSLSAFVRRKQSGLNKKSRTSFSLKPKRGVQTTDDGLSPCSEGVSEGFLPMTVRRPRTGFGSRSAHKNPNSEDSLCPVSGGATIASAPDQSQTMKNQRSNDGLCEVSSCIQENPLSGDQTRGISSVPASTDESMRCSNKISTESTLEESISTSALRKSYSGLVACSNKTMKLDDGELNGQTDGIQEVNAVDPCNSDQLCDLDAEKFLGVHVKDSCSALDQQSMGISTVYPSSAGQNLCSSSSGKEILVTCLDDSLNKPCENASPETHKQLSGKYLDRSSKTPSKNFSPHHMKMEEASKSKDGTDLDQCMKDSQHTQLRSSYYAFDYLKREETCSDFDCENKIPGTYTKEPELASVSLQKEETVISGGRFSPTTVMSSGFHQSESEKYQETGNIPNQLSQGLDLNEITSVQKYSSTSHQNQPSDDVSRGTSIPSHDNFSVDEEANGASSPSIAPDQNESYPEDAVSVPDSENKDNKLSAVQRAARKSKKRRHGDMAYEGDADWEILIHEQGFLESHPVVDSDRSFRTREKFDSSSNMVTEAENGGTAAVSAGLKARAAGPVEKIKFREVLKRKGGLQEYLECRNQILGLWSKDVSRILPLAECGVTDSPSEDEPPRASLIREVYAFLDQSGYINVGIASEKEKADPSAKHNYKLVKEKNFVEISGALVADSEDGVSFILGRVKSSETSVEAKNGVIFDDKNQTSEARKGRKFDTQKTLEVPSSTEREKCAANDFQENGFIDAKPPNTMINLDVLRADPSSEVLDIGTIPVVTPELKNDSYGVQSTLIDYVDENNHGQNESEVRKRIIVIGAGPAGLTAARHLQRQGFSVSVLEARSRLGGRVYTDHSSLSVPVDLGASIITGVEADVATERRPDPSSLVCAQLGLELTVLNSDCPLYDVVTGQKVPADLDEALEAEYNGLLDDMVLVVAQKGEHAMRMSLEDGLEYALKRRRIARSGTYNEVIKLHKSVDGFSDSEKISVDSEIPNRNSSKEEILSPLERRVMDWHFAHLEYGCAASLKEVSLPYWNQDDVYGGFGGAHCMIKGGYSTVVESLGEGLQIHLNHVVTDISYSRQDFVVTDDHCNKVKVCTSNGGEFSGDAVLVTVPLGCLKAETIKFTPPLPQWKHSSIQRLGFGVLNKVVMEFPEVFWDDSVDYFGATAEETNQRGQCFMFWNIRKTVGAPVLIALVVGKAAIDGQNMSSSDHVNHALLVLRKLFGDTSVPDPVASVVTDWGRDPFSYGAYSYVAVGASGEDYDILGRPVENCLFFAGEATCKEHPDTVGGAMMSGLREAVRIVDIFSTGNDYTAEVDAMEAAQRHSDSERDEVRDITKRLDAVELSNVLYKNSLDGAPILTREALLQDMFCNAKTTAGRLHLAKELLALPVETLKSFAGTKEGLTTLNSWILSALIRLSFEAVFKGIPLKGIGKTVKEKVCVHTSRDIRAIASQLVSVWIEIFRKEKASNGGLKLLRQATAMDSSRSKSLKGLSSGKPPLRTHHGALDSKGSLQVPSSAGSHLPSNTNMKKVNGKPVKLETMTDSRSDINSSRSEGSIGRMDTRGDEDNVAMSEEEQAALAAAEAARAAALAAAEAYASSEAKCNTSLQLPKIPSFHKFARREQYAQADESDLRRKWSGGVLGRQDCISEIDSRNCRVRNWSVDFSAACVNLDSSRMSVDNLSQRSHSNEIACQLNFGEHSGESAAVDSSLFTKAWVDTAGSVGLKDYHAIERWQSQAAAADSGFFHPSMLIKDEEDSSTISKLPTWKHDRLANESSVSQVTVNKQLAEDQLGGAERIKQAVVDYVASLLMPLYKARKIEKEGYKSIMKKTATKVMEQATDAEKAMTVSEFLDFKRKNKIRSFVDKLIEKHMAMKPVGKS
ncbi:hypothetical protein L1049_026731 [Liquidambar formosana]|uniref:SWIRM domain-containing protein n=1 Tax=Liquidambar formosana TaxID=63359 RepID=A0AAP0ND82_LIQFO